MDLNFAPPAEVTDLARRVADFVKTRIVPYEKDPRWTPHGPTDELRIEMNDLARAAGVFAPHVPKEYGGLALGQVGRAFVFEAAGYSILGRRRSTAPRPTRATSICSTSWRGPTSARIS